ncbi:class I adenylate-forming enzyme family protein [Glaciimonas immobilis]|uniref:Fatty-acyl-CoA synthase n=1 Tax=Glaciimonas immobilis TaxID=728004 RepID=A0A840RWB7_9BURK|nr:class I adenylate-forming enzyme family protein [Glaciimonas immobilis]KAF3996483.1 acyl--CoA ligase [Glaciimonas immobilis]MBB5201166.1 fatty-acyl-CoA synthase [Glaciimonas immobilis]
MKPPFSRTLIDLVREQAAYSNEACALVCAQGRFTYADLAQRAAKVAGAFQAAGVQRGDRVGVLLSNRVEWLDVCLGAGALGATLVPLSTWSTRNELAFLLADSKLVLFISAARFGDRDFESDFVALQGMPGVPVPERIWLLDNENGAAKFPSYNAIIDGASPLSALAAGVDPDANDDALVLYTSGSTSAPKAVPLRQFAVVENGFNIGEREGLTRDDRVLLSSPLFWAFGGANALPATFGHGATLVLMEKFDPALAMDIIEREGCTAIYTLPAMTSAIAYHRDYRKERLATMRTGVTIGSSDEFLFAVEILGATELCNIYGATETCGNCAVTWHHWSAQRRSLCQGPPLPGQEIRFIDEDTGVEALPGMPGLAEVRGYTTLGYSGASAEQNASAFSDDGFYRTGDMGLLNADGDFVFVGRVGEMIKRAGINVSPAEVEAVMRKHPSVQEVAVVGVPDAIRGELIFAFVVPINSEDFDSAALLRHCGAELSKYKVPDHIEPCASLPLTATGKLQRRQLKQLALERALALAAIASQKRASAA